MPHTLACPQAVIARPRQQAVVVPVADIGRDRGPPYISSWPLVPECCPPPNVVPASPCRAWLRAPITCRSCLTHLKVASLSPIRRRPSEDRRGRSGAALDPLAVGRSVSRSPCSHRRGVARSTVDKRPRSAADRLTDDRSSFGDDDVLGCRHDESSPRHRAGHPLRPPSFGVAVASLTVTRRPALQVSSQLPFSLSLPKSPVVSSPLPPCPRRLRYCLAQLVRPLRRELVPGCANSDLRVRP